MEANPAVRPPDGRRTVLSFGLASFLLFSVLFLGSRAYLVYAGNGRVSGAFPEVLGGFLEDVSLAAILSLSTILALSVGRGLYFGAVFPLKLIIVITCYANFQFVQFYGDGRNLRLFDLEYVRNMGTTWKNTVFRDLWVRPSELLFIIVPLAAIVLEFILLARSKPAKATRRRFWAFSAAFGVLALSGLSGGAALKNQADPDGFHQNNYLVGFFREAPKLHPFFRAAQTPDPARKGKGPEETVQKEPPLPLPDGYVRYGGDYPFIKVPKTDAYRLGLIQGNGGGELRQPEKRDKRLRNIVFIFLESFRCREIGRFGGPYSLTPSFDALASKSTLFTNFYGHSDMTAGAEFTVLNSFYDTFKGVTAMREHERVALFSLPEILGLLGFSNYWINSWPAAFDNTERFFRLHGDFTMIDRSLFPKTARKAGWSYSDEEIMDKALETMDKARKPFFAMVLTATNHIPYEVPGKEFDLGLESEVFGKYLNAFHYTDYALGRFFERVRNRDYFRDTLFFIFADHGNNRKTVEKRVSHFEYFDNVFHIPLLIYDPSEERGSVVEEVAGQVDIAPTVLDLLGIEIADPFVGQSLARKRKDSFYLAYHGRDEPWVFYYDESLLCRYNFENGRLSSFDRKRGVETRPDEGERGRIIAKVRRMLTLGDWSIDNDRIWDRKIDGFYRNLYRKD